MGSKSQWKQLNRSLGYEVAILTLKNPLSKKEIQKSIPYEYLSGEENSTQIFRIVKYLFDDQILNVAGTMGTDEFYLADSEFCHKELMEINRRAITRMHFPAEERGPPVPLREIPDEFFKKYNRSDVYFGSEQVLFVEAFSDENISVYHLDKNSTSLKIREETEIISGVHADAAQIESKFKGLRKKPWTWD